MFSMNGNGNEVLAQAQEMLAESGRLDITARRKLWQAMGALEVREQDSATLRTLTEPLKKRARLALACAKKVMPIWCKCDSEDKRPQGFIKKSYAYLDGEIAAEAAAASYRILKNCLTKWIDQTHMVNMQEDMERIGSKSGQADSLQGELLRQAEKLRHEAIDHGNLNWDNHFDKKQ